MIRPMELKDLEWVRIERNRLENNIWFRQDHDITPEEQDNWFKTTTMKSFIVNDNKGVVALSHFDNSAKKCEFSVMISPEHRGRGYGTQAMKDILDYAFNTLNMNMVYSDVFFGNPAINLYTKIGFNIYGTLPNWYFKNGSYINSSIIAITKDEYNSQ